MRVALIIAAAFTSSALLGYVTGAHAGSINIPAALCDYGVMLAHKAYIEGTYDAQRPDSKRLHYMVDYWGDAMTVRYDPAVAHAGVDFIAAGMKSTGLRRVDPGVAYEVARKFAIINCEKYRGS